MIRVAVIDDGISMQKIKELDFNILIKENCEIEYNNIKTQEFSHGTICALIIKKYAPKVSLGSIKILKTHGKRGYVNQFKKAIEWCIQNDISLINISLEGLLKNSLSEPKLKIVCSSTQKNSD